MIYIFNHCEFDTQLFELRYAGELAELEPKVFDMLRYLIEHHARVVPKQELFDQLWPDQFISDATFDHCLMSARKAVGDDGRRQQVIKTIRRRGYRFVADFTTREPATDTPPMPAAKDPLPINEQWQCTFCQHLNPTSGAEMPRFCMACGSPRSGYCPQCGQTTHPGAKFCALCGASLASPEPAASTTEHPESATPDNVPQTPRSTQEERRQLTVLACELANADVLSRHLELEDYIDIIRTYQHRFAEAVRYYEGHIAQYLGAGLLAYFGYPLAHEDDPQRAIWTGLDIVDAFKTLSADSTSVQDVELAVRIGIHTGPVIVSSIDLGERQEPLALGEPPTIATRIQLLGKPNTVMISADTERLVQGYFICRATEPGDGPEERHATPRFQVLLPTGAQGRLDAANPVGLTPMVGREAELNLLLLRWAQVEEGLGQIILLSGEPGIGKSRLVRALVERLESSYIYLECRGSPYHQNTALYPVLGLCQRLFYWLESDTSDEKVQKLESVLSQLNLPFEETLSLFAEFLSVPHESVAPLSLHLTPQQQRNRLLEVLLSMVLELAAHQPLIFFVDDLHWVDPSTLEWLTMLVDQVPRSQLYMVFTARPTFQAPWGNRSYLSEVTLSHLPRRDVEAMVAAVIKGKSLPDEVLQQVVDKTDGVPLFVEELTKAVVESEWLEEANGDFRLTSAMPDVTIPSTLQDSLMARLDRLGMAKEVAQWGAAIGRQFSHEVLQAVSPWETTRLRQELDRLVKAELIYRQGLPSQSMYVFKHALIQETAYQSLVRSTRQQYHRHIAEVLAEQFPAMIGDEPEILAYHYTEAGLIELAIPAWQKAGERATARAAEAEVIGHLNKGLELLYTLPEALERDRQELKLLSILKDSVAVVKGYASTEFEHIIIKSRDLCQRLEDWQEQLEILSRLHGVYISRMQLRQALEISYVMLESTRNINNIDGTFRSYNSLGMDAFHVGIFTEALTYLKQGLEFCELHHNYDPVFNQRVRCLLYTSWSLWFLGYPDQSLLRLEQARTAAHELSHPYSLGSVLHFASTLYKWRREAMKAQEQAEGCNRAIPGYLVRAVESESR